MVSRLLGRRTNFQSLCSQRFNQASQVRLPTLTKDMHTTFHGAGLQNFKCAPCGVSHGPTIIWGTRSITTECVSEPEDPVMATKWSSRLPWQSVECIVRCDVEWVEEGLNCAEVTPAPDALSCTASLKPKSELTVMVLEPIQPPGVDMR